MADAAPLSNVPNDLLAQAMESVGKLMRAKKSAAMRVQAEIARFKELGVNPRALKDAIKLRESSPEDFHERMTQFLRFMGIEGYQVGSEALFAGLDLSPLGPEALQRHKEWQASDIAFQEAIGGTPREGNPFKPGSAWYDAWDRGWIDGHAVLVETLPPKVEQAPTRLPRAPAAAAPKTQTEREAAPMWDGEAKATAEKVAAEMDEANAAAEGDDDPGLDLGLPDVGPATPRQAAAPVAPEPTAKRGPGRPKGAKNLAPSDAPSAPAQRGRPKKGPAEAAPPF